MLNIKKNWKRQNLGENRYLRYCLHYKKVKMEIRRGHSKNQKTKIGKENRSTNTDITKADRSLDEEMISRKK